MYLSEEKGKLIAEEIKSLLQVRFGELCDTLLDGYENVNHTDYDSKITICLEVKK